MDKRSRSQRSIAAEAAFRTSAAGAGAEVLELEWLGAQKPHRVRCADGHECHPRPNSVQQGQGICRVCAGRDSVTAWANFRAQVAELGAKVLEKEWLGSNVAHRVICAKGHVCNPRPHDVQQGGGICRVCVGHDPATAWANFQARIAGIGGKVLEPEWLGALVKHRVRCAKGHKCNPRPADVQKGRGICLICARLDPATAWANFRVRVFELGGEVLELKWLGKGKPHRVRCVEGHVGNPRPNAVQKGGGICRVCAKKDPATSWANFRIQVTELGAEVLELKWLGSNKPHRVRCAAGHECTPLPSGVQQGEGICRLCAGKVWDRFYVVVNRPAHRVKFGVTSNSFRRRLGDHRQFGYTEVLRIVELPSADLLEREVLGTLALADIQPVRGREYFDLTALPVILDVADNYLGSLQTTS